VGNVNNDGPQLIEELDHEEAGQRTFW